MGRMTYWMNVSLDGFIEGAPGEQGGGSWMRIGEELHREFNRRASELAMGVEGRVTYEIMEAFWPGAVGDETQPEVMREYARIWTTSDKVLVSNTRTEADYNTRVIGGDGAMEELARLRETTAGTIGVGGATLATALLRHGLLDELQLAVHPVLLGAGRPLFDELDAPLELELIDQASFERGVVINRYEVSGAR